MEALVPPKLLAIAPSDRMDSKDLPKKLWAIDSPTLEWTLGIAYLLSAVKKRIFEHSLYRLLKFKERPKVDKWIPRAKRSVVKYNPFKNNRHAIYFDRILNIIVKSIKLKIHAEVKLNDQKVSNAHLLEAAANLFNCVIMFYVVDMEGTCKLLSIFNSEIESCEGSLQISIFQRNSESSTSSDSIEKFGFGLSVEDSLSLKEFALVHCLKIANISDDQINRVRQVKRWDTNFPGCLFKEGCEYIISSIYKSPYIVSLISEAGFDTNPCSLDNSGFSSFFHSMGLLENNSLSILYNFASKTTRSTDSLAEDTVTDMLITLEIVGSVIETDCLKSNNFLLLGRKKDIALKRYHEILRFNEYQRKICQKILEHKQKMVGLDLSTNIMISILSIYNEYFNFLSINTDGEEKVFKEFLRFNDYHEYIDNFTCLLFFKNLSNLIPLINKHNSKLYYDAISSLYLMVLSNEHFPFYTHEIHCNNCELNYDDCEQIMNCKRFIHFYYRRQFLKNVENLTQNLSIKPSGQKPSKSQQTKPSNTKQKKPLTFLDILRTSLKNLPEIVDEFIIIRLINHLKVVNSMHPQDSSIKMMLTVKRVLQIVGETLDYGNESLSVVRFLLRSCISSELISKLCSMRDNTLSHHRENNVFGKLQTEQDEQLVQNIQQELKDIDGMFLPVYISQIYRVTEFLIKEVKVESQNTYGNTQWALDIQLRTFNRKRRREFQKQESNFYALICKVFRRLRENLAKEGVHLSKDTKSGLKALNFLVNFVADHYNSNYSAELKEVVIEFGGSNEISQEMISEVERVLAFNVSVTEKIFKNLQKEEQSDVNFPCIFSLNDKIKNFEVLSDSEKNMIRCKVTKYVKNSADLIKSLKTSLNEGKMIENVGNKLNLIIMPEYARYFISKKIEKHPGKALCKLHSVKEEEDLEKIWNFDPCNNILTSFREREELLNMLLKIKFSKKLKRKIVRLLNHKLLFLVNRINQLKTILIYEDERISALWRSSRLKPDAVIEEHMKFLMMQRYTRESELQASLEMLLFDCMNILDQRDDLKVLWEKTNDLFKGANIADFLAHGNPILQSVGSTLCPEDLPSEFINKIMELIQDADAIRALMAMWEKTKLCKISEFFNAVRSEEEDEHSNLRRRIKKCEGRWKGYAELLPLRR